MRTLGRPADEAEIRERLRAVRPDSRALWGRMCCHEMLCHLADSVRMAFGERDVKPVGGPLDRTLVKWLALWAPLRWPHGLPTLPEIDPRRAGSHPEAFAADRAVFEALLGRMTAEAERLDRRPHPLFGPLSRRDWLRWGWVHADHHLRQFGA